MNPRLPTVRQNFVFVQMELPMTSQAVYSTLHIVCRWFSEYTCVFSLEVSLSSLLRHEILQPLSLYSANLRDVLSLIGSLIEESDTHCVVRFSRPLDSLFRGKVAYMIWPSIQQKKKADWQVEGASLYSSLIPLADIVTFTVLWRSSGDATPTPSQFSPSLGRRRKGSSIYIRVGRYRSRRYIPYHEKTAREIILHDLRSLHTF